jgi:ribosome assembly protein RRB1
MEEVDDVEMGRNGNSNNEGEVKAATYLPGQPLKEDEELVCDESAYVMLHEVHTGKNDTPRG